MDSVSYFMAYEFVHAGWMRPIDLMAFKIDDQHKNFIKSVHNEEKNYKLAKRFDAYSWGHSDDFQLGYT